MSRSLIGRSEELRQIVELLDEWRLVTIVGPGGAGKTRLAEAVLEDVDGSTETHFVGLASHTNDRLAETAAAELGSSSLDDFCRATADRSALIVLDNCEHVLDAAAHVAEFILEDCPGLAILATSREPLELEDERLVPIVGLPTEAGAEPSPAAELYLTEVEARGMAMEAEIDDIERLVRQLDGLPLAIELAAAKARTASPAEMLHDLEPRIDLLARRRDRGPSRHRSLAAAIRWSFEQLSEDEQRFLLACSLFEGLFTHGMAAAITGKTRSEAVTLLQSLVDRSLVHHEQIGAATWHRLLVTIRTFCRDELQKTESPEASQERLIAAALQTVEAQPYSHLSIGYTDGAARATAAFDTVRKVVDHCVAHDTDPDRVYRILRWVWWLDAGAYQSEAANLCDRVFARWDERSQPAWPLAAASAATLYRDVGRRDEAAAVSRAVLQSNDDVAKTLAHRTLGLMHRAEGDYDIAEEHLAKAIELAADADLDALADEIRVHLALNLAWQGSVSKAMELTARVERTTATQLGSANHIWIGLVHAVLIAPENPDQAADILDDLQMHIRAGGSPWAVAALGTVRGLVHAAVGELADAGAKLGRSLGLFYGAGDRPEAAWAAQAASVTLRRAGDDDGAAMAAGIAKHCMPEMHLPDRDAEWMSAIAPLPEPAPIPSLAAAVNDVCKRLAALAAGTPTDQQVTDGVFRQRGDSWEVGMGGETKHVRDSKGMHDLARLLRNPGVPQAAVDLIGAKVVSGSHGPASDSRALREYRTKLAELDERIADADAFGDADGAEIARLEKEAILRHVGKSYAILNKQRVTGDPAEKARSAVTWRIRAAIKNIRAVDGRVAEHLDSYVQTGRECVYTPAAPLDWAF